MPQQISVFAENKPGKTERISGILGSADINIRAITISDSGDYGIIKILVDRPAEGCAALNRGGVAATLKDIVVLAVEDRPGGLHRAASVLARHDINVDDAYGFTMREGERAVFVFQVKDPLNAERTLLSAGFKILTDTEIYRI